MTPVLPAGLVPPLVRGCLMALAWLASSASAAVLHADETGPPAPVEFLRVHVPAGRLGAVPLGDGRYVPMTVAEFDAAVARAADPLGRADGLVPRAVAEAARYEAQVDDDGMLVGRLTCTIPAGVADLARALPLGRLVAREGSVMAAAGPRDIAIFGIRDAGSFMQILEGGVYSCGFTCPPAGDPGGGFRLPLAPAVMTTVELSVPAGIKPVLFGAAARGAVVSAPPAVGAGTWRIEVGPAAELGLRFRPAATDAVGLAVWSTVAVRGQQATLAANVRPAGPWGDATVTLEKDPSLRIAAVQAGMPAEPLDFVESSDGRELVITIPVWLAGGDSPLVVSGVAPAAGQTWRLPLLAAKQGRWSAGGTVLAVDPVSGIAALELDDCRIVTDAVAARWPLPPGGAAHDRPADDTRMRPATVHVEEQAAGAACRVTLRPRTPTLDVARVTTVEISPRAVLGRAACDIRVVDGEAFEITARLAPGWIPDAVEAVDWADDGPLPDAANRRPSSATLPIDWRFIQSPGGDLLRIGLPIGATPARGLGLRVTGHRAGIAPGAAFTTADIDMVRFDGEPAGSAFIDVKTVADSFLEIDEQPVGMLPAEGRLARLVEGGAIRGRIAAGDLAPNRRARLVARRPAIDADVGVRLELREERLAESFEGACRAEAGGLDSVVIDFSEPVGEGLEWSVASPEGTAVTARLLTPGDSSGRFVKRSDAIAESWLLEFRPPVEESVVVRGVRTVPFTAAVPVPLAWVGDAVAPRGVVTVRAAGPRLPDVVNHRLQELPPAIEGPAARLRAVEFTYGGPAAAAGPAAELLPAAAGAAARAWAWREAIICWCDESGAVDCETRFEIENEGRDAVSVTVAAGTLLQSIAVDGTLLPVDVGGAANATLRVPLPVAERRIDLAIRTRATADASRGFWKVQPHGSGIDLPVLERTVRLMVPPGLEPLVADAAYRSAEPPTAGWAERLFAVRAAGGFLRGPAPPTAVGYRPQAFIARSGREAAGIVVIHRRLLTSAALVVAVVTGGLAALCVARRRGVAVTLCVAAALAALWIAPPLHLVARAAWWAAVAGCAWGLLARRSAIALVLALAAATPAAAREPEMLKVFVTPGADGDMALVPEPLFRRLAASGPAAAAIRVLDCRVVVPTAEPTSGWSVTLEVDADAGGTLLVGGAGTWRPAASAAADGVLARAVDRDVRLTATAAGRQRVVLLVEPRVERRGAIDVAEVDLPGAGVASLRVVGESLASGAIACERAAGDGPFLRAASLEDGEDAAFDLSGASRVRLLRAVDPRDRIAAGPATAATVNDVFWGLDACTVQTTFSVDTAGDLLHAWLVRADERLEQFELTGENDPPVLRAAGPGRWLVELPRPLRGKLQVRLTSRMPMADSVGRSVVPAVWLEGVAAESRTLRVDAAADLDLTIDPPVTAGVTAAEFEAGGVPRATVRRRRQQARGVQNLAVTFGDDRLTLALQGQIDATSLALTEIPLQVPPGCIIDRVTLHEDDLMAAEGRSQPAVDVMWTRKATDRVSVVVQQPRAGRFRLTVDARLRIRPPARGRVPLLRAEIAGGPPLLLACSSEPASGLRVRYATSSDAAPAAEVVEVAADQPGPEYVLEKAAPPDEPRAAVAAVTAPPPAQEMSRVECADVWLSLDGRGRMHGAVRFDLTTSDPTLLLRLPAGTRLFDVLVDGTQVTAVPRAADTWELRLHDTAWPRTVFAVFAGDAGLGGSDGRPISVSPPTLVGLPTAAVLWTLAAPPGFELRLAEPARPLDAEMHAAKRREAQRAISERFERLLPAADPRQHARLQSLFDLRRAAGLTREEAAWQRAVGWPTATGADPRIAFAAADAAAPLTLRAVRQSDGTTPGRAIATCGVVLTAGLAWILAAWQAGRRR